ncbi:MAG: hypothetical protein ACTTJC_02785 [Campylobacter sp.]
MDSITKQERIQLEEVFSAICANKNSKFKGICLRFYRGFCLRTSKFMSKTNYKFINNIRIRRYR